MHTRRYNTRGFSIGIIGVAVVAVLSAIVMVLWNLLVPAIFGIAKITYWQAAGIFVLTRILFGSFWNRERSLYRHPLSRFHPYNHLHEKWMKMTPEERKEFINKRRECMRNNFFGKEEFFSHGHGCDFNESDDSKKSDDK